MSLPRAALLGCMLSLAVSLTVPAPARAEVTLLIPSRTFIDVPAEKKARNPRLPKRPPPKKPRTPPTAPRRPLPKPPVRRTRPRLPPSPPRRRSMRRWTCSSA